MIIGCLAFTSFGLSRQFFFFDDLLSDELEEELLDLEDPDERMAVDPEEREERLVRSAELLRTVVEEERLELPLSVLRKERLELLLS